MKPVSTLRSLLNAEPNKMRPGLFLGVIATYGLAYVSLAQVLDRGAGILSTLPVAAIAWLMGLRAAVLASLLAFLIHSLFVVGASDTAWHEWIQRGGGLGTGALVLVAVVIGHLSDLRWKLYREREVVETMLSEHMRTEASAQPRSAVSCWTSPSAGELRSKSGPRSMRRRCFLRRYTTASRTICSSSPACSICSLRI